MHAGRSARFPGALALLGICVLLASCGSNAKIIYDSPGTTAIGPRLALLPVILDTNVSDPSVCMEACDFTKDRYALALAANDYLADVLSYDTVCLSNACASVPGNPWEQDEIEDWASRAAAWARDQDREQGLPQDLSGFVNQLAKTFDVDSVMLIHGDVDYLRVGDMAHWMATLTVSMYRDLFTGNVADVAIDIYAAETGEKLWASEAELTHYGVILMGGHPDMAEPYGPVLFEGLEDANR